jgi:hypothetical protein
VDNFLITLPPPSAKAVDRENLEIGFWRQKTALKFPVL